MPRKILVVEKNDVDRSVLRHILKSEYEVIEAGTGHEALNALHHKHKLISAVLLDTGTRATDCFEVLSEIHSNAVLSQIPVIVTASSREDRMENRAIAFGACAFVTRPYNPALILSYIRNAITFRESASLLNAIKRDKLTGLLNREAFFERANAMIHEREPGSYVMACFDIDNFKLVNDQFGAEEGDRILKHIGAVVKRTVEKTDGVCGRISADNFAVLYSEKYASDGLLTTLLQSDAAIPKDCRAAITFSVGHYLVTDLRLSASTIYDRALIAKRSVKGRFDEHIASFDESMLEKLIREQTIINEMNAALVRRQFDIWYQPQFNHATGALIGAEALARWRHPSRGTISPVEFIPVFEQNGFIYELDKFAWERVCEQLRKWMDEGLSPLPVSVNISRYDVFRDDLIDVLLGLTGQYGVPVDLLRLEITESAFTKSSEQIIAVVRRLIGHGFTVEIDDFGSGYSSLNTLKDVPANVIKLDMRFLESSKDSSRGGNILESVVRMAKWLDMAVIAEGVEDVGQADFLKSIGCTYVQGYLYAKPMPVKDYEALLRTSGKEKQLIAMETVANLDNNSFWDPRSMDTLIFNSYIGGACIFEYHMGKIELLRANDKYARVIGSSGMTVEDALRLNWEEYMDKRSLAAADEAVRRSLETSDEVTADYLFLNLPGCPEKTYLRSTIRVIASSGNRFLIYCTNENITAQRSAEETGRDASEQLRSVIDDMPGGFTRMRIRKDGAIETVYLNEGFCRLVRLKHAEAMALYGADALKGIHAEDVGRVQKLIASILKSGGPGSVKCRLRGGGDSYVPVTVICRVTSRQGETFLNAYYTDAAQAAWIKGDETELSDALERLRICEEERRLALEYSGNAICRYLVAERTLRVPKVFAEHQELPDTFLNVPTGPIKDGFVSPDTAEAYASFFDAVARGEKTGEATFKWREGSIWRWVEGRFSAIFTPEGQPLSAIVSFVDVTDRLEKEMVYKKWQQSLGDKPLDSYTLCRCNISRDAGLTAAEGELLDASLYQDGKSFNARAAAYAARCVHEEDRERYLSHVSSDGLLAGYYRGKRFDALEYRELLSGGGVRWLHLAIDLVEHPESTDVEAYLMYENIDDRKRAELLSIRRAETDPLTGALNRAAFASRAEKLIASLGEGKMHALLMLDVDGFKRVNDVFGHGAGDQALVDIAEHMRRALRKNDLLGRLGGDEFVVFLADIPSDLVAQKKAGQLCAVIRKSFSAEVRITASIGIVLCPRDGADFDTLYKKVDIALYHVKETGKDGSAFYFEGMEEQRTKVRPAAHPEEVRTERRKKRMLIVDDSRTNCAFLSNMFKDDFLIETAQDGASALVRMRHFGSALSVVLLDLIMPAMDGFAVLDRMRASPELKGIPVIVVSGADERDTLLKTIRCGASDFVVKPIDADLLRLRVRSAVTKAENERLEAQNSFLEMEKRELAKYRFILEQERLALVEHDWIRDTFQYDKTISGLLAGAWDGRSLWQILLGDGVADERTVREMQELVRSVAVDGKRFSGDMSAALLTPDGAKKRFRINVYKSSGEGGMAERIVMTFARARDGTE